MLEANGSSNGNERDKKFWAAPNTQLLTLRPEWVHHIYFTVLLK